MAFRKKQKLYVSPPTPVEVVESVTVAKEVNGDIVNVLEVKVIDTCSQEFKSRIPDPEIFTLEYCLSAGINLDMVKASNLLTPTDLADFELHGAAISQETFNQLVELNKSEE